MTKLRTLMTRIRRDEEGATAIEYGLLAALIAVVLIVVITVLGQQLFTTFDSVQVGLGGTTVAAPAAPAPAPN
jgi:pilus assembly protein Flp/PilA